MLLKEKLILNEDDNIEVNDNVDLDTKVEPEVENNAVISSINDLLSEEFISINNYNSIIATISDKNISISEDILNDIKGIIEDKNIIIGQLTSILKKLGVDFNESGEDDIYVDESLNKNLVESKQDIVNFKNFAGEELANRFFNIKNRIQGEEKDIYYWIKQEKDLINDMESHSTDSKEKINDEAHKKVLELLSNFISTYEDTPTRSQSYAQAKEGAEKIYEDDNWLVLYIKSYEASCKYGRNTRWCISGTDTSNNDGGISDWNKHSANKMYFYINKNDEHSKYALEFSSLDNWCLWNSADFVDVGKGDVFKDGIIACGDSWSDYAKSDSTYPAFPYIKGLPDLQQAYRDAIENAVKNNEN